MELFKSLSQSSALACIKLATSWLSRSEASIQTKVVDQVSLLIFITFSELCRLCSVILQCAHKYNAKVVKQFLHLRIDDLNLYCLAVCGLGSTWSDWTI